MRKLILMGFVVSLMVFSFRAFDANAGFMFSDMAPCQKILFQHDTYYPFETAYRCKGFAEGLPFQNQCVCYRANNPTEFVSFLSGCTNLANCACDGFLDNFNTAQSDFLCDGSGFAYKGHLFFLWVPKIDVKGVFDGADTANLVCFPDPTCQYVCNGCSP